MIHGNSNDPVNVKKIALKVWTLKNEIRATIKKQINEEGEVDDIQSIIDEYKNNGATASTPTEVKKEEELDDSEDAMSKALAEADKEEDSEDKEEETDGEEEKGKTTEIIQRRPDLDENQVYHAKTLLAEIAMDRMFFFCSKTFTEGRSVVIEFLVPKRFVINAEVIYCRLFNMKSRIISKNKLSYRIAVDFNFLKEGERTLLRQFLKTIEPEVYEHIDTTKIDKEDDDDDEFSELDDL